MINFKRRLIPFSLLLSCFTIAFPQDSYRIAQPGAADAIVEKFINAIGGYESIKAIDNLIYTGGTYEEKDFKSNGNATMSLGRPYHKLVGNKSDPGSYMEGYDGMAWEWFKDPGVVLHTVGAASEAIRHYAGVENPLVDYKEKGSKVDFLGEVEFDGKRVNVLLIERLDGYKEHYYLSAETGLIVATSGAAPIHAFGAEVLSLTRVEDYRSVNGVLIPHKFMKVRLPSTEPLSSMQWKKIEANVKLPNRYFSPPEFTRTPVQEFIEALYYQRSDINAVMWTYTAFRNAHKEVNTNKAVNFVGYHFLKMSEVDNAIRLLEQNQKDYPDAIDTHYELCLAYKTAGRIDEARQILNRIPESHPLHKKARSELLNME